MKAYGAALCRIVLIMVTLLVLPAGIMAQDSEESGQEYKFSREELTQMLAPIALYPDALTAQILMASTYPLEVVEADRWVSKNLQLKGNDLDNALQGMEWDPSVKSLCHFPDILKSMSDKLDQTRKLGDAFLGQEDEVMATIQELRAKARDQGNLKTTGEQKVVVEDKAIRIEPVNPDLIYVPVYDPAYVYGPWWYPAYPPYYWYYPPGVYNSAYIGFGPGVFFGFNAFSWVWFDWPRHRVHIDADRTRSFDHLRGRDERRFFWRHDPQHRRGVAYRDLRTNQRFGYRAPRPSSPLNREKRGYPGTYFGQQTQPSRIPAQRDRVQTAPQTPRERQSPAAVTPAPATRRESAPATRLPSSAIRPLRPVAPNSPFRGVGEGSFERRAGERGGKSSQGVVTRPERSGVSGDRKQFPDGDGSRGRQGSGNR